MPRPTKYKKVFAVVYRRKEGRSKFWNDFGDRDTWMTQCEKKERLIYEYPDLEFKVLHQKLLDEKGQAA